MLCKSLTAATLMAVASAAGDAAGPPAGPVAHSAGEKVSKENCCPPGHLVVVTGAGNPICEVWSIGDKWLLTGDAIIVDTLNGQSTVKASSPKGAGKWIPMQCLKYVHDSD